MIDFNTLNQQQSNAVTALFGKIKIVAGAGSGKTRVLATRYAYLTETIGIDSNNILCLTFTNKAAQEMKRRILSMISNSAIINDFICTIHGFCVKFLRQEIYRLGYPKTFNIIDNEDSKGYAKKIMEQFGQDRSVQTVKQFLTNINRQKNILRSDYIPLMLSGATLKEDNEFEMYLREQLKTFSLDFNDLIHFTTYILNKFSDVREKWQEQFNFIMVDEVQDCNLSDWEIITILSARHGNLFIVGDPDQAIYEWRGAKPELFVQFSSDQQIILNENYRSTKNILDIANSVITNNDNRIQKDLFTRKKKYQHAIYFHGHSEIEEATWVVNNIKDAIQRDVKPQDIAILYRASHNSRIFEQQLIKEQVPYTIWGGIRFFERKEIKDI
ncbi:MAG: UvrD-helicase domain-containing protein, partial [Bacteroidales bacterium]|nr:UvrD-helicase domain-containing protein [Candidatus Sodaliphilus limicaballi]